MKWRCAAVNDDPMYITVCVCVCVRACVCACVCVCVPAILHADLLPADLAFLEKSNTAQKKHHKTRTTFLNKQSNLKYMHTHARTHTHSHTHTLTHCK